MTTATSPLDDDMNDIEYDERTDLKVAGYIRNIQKQLSSPINIIAKELFCIVLSYTRCGDLYGGTFEWCINKELMHKMFVSSSKERFVSQQFEIGGVEWEIFAYPNGSGHRDRGSFKLFLKPRFIPLHYNKITLFAGFYCFETQSGDATIFTFDKNQQKCKFYSKQHGSMLLDDIKYRLSDQLRIKINIKILKIVHNLIKVFYPNSKNKINLTQSFSWRISGELMKEMKYCYLRKCFISKIFHKMWCLKIYPSGHSGDKTVRIELQICSFPAIIRNDVAIKGMLIIRNWTRSAFEHKFDYTHSAKDCGTKLLTFKGFKSCDELIIDVQIYILHSVHTHARSAKSVQSVQSVQGKGSGLSVGELHQRMIAGLNAIEGRRLIDIKTVTQRLDTMEHLRLNNIKSVTHLQRMEHLRLDNIKTLTQRFDKTVANAFNQITQIYQHNLAQLQQQINVLTQKVNENTRQSHSHSDGYQEMSEYDIIRIWLYDIDLSQYFELLIKNGYDNSEIVMDLDDDALKQIGIHKIGHRRKIIKYKNMINEIANRAAQNDTNT